MVKGFRILGGGTSDSFVETVKSIVERFGGLKLKWKLAISLELLSTPLSKQLNFAKRFKGFPKSTNFMRCLRTYLLPKALQILALILLGTKQGLIRRGFQCQAETSYFSLFQQFFSSQFSLE